MQQGALFDSGILGTSFHWWIGQIADDSTWRDNVACRPTESSYENKGWGRRYRVRILGLHDQGEQEIPSNKLPWAQIMYPVTAGSSNTNSMQSPNLRQGNLVFGFFLDGQEMRIPVIMGVMGNNAQTIGSAEIGTDRVTNTQPGSLAISGYATGARPKNPNTGEKETPPDSDLRVQRPGVSPESAPIPPGVNLNKYGLRGDISPTPEQYRDEQEARAEAERKGLSFAETQLLVSRRVLEGVQNRKNKVESPTTPPAGPAYRESPDVQQVTAADVKREIEYEKKTALAKPDDLVQSAIKSTQIAIDNLSNELDRHLQSIQSYIDAVSNPGSSIEKILQKGANELAKYMKVIFDKVMEFVLKQINVVMSEVVSAMPTSLRNFIADIKEKLNELITGLYNKMTEGLIDQIKSVLNEVIAPQEKEAAARRSTFEGGFNQFRTTPKVTICQAETLTATLLAKNKKSIDNANTNAIKNINSFVDGLQGQMGSVNGLMSSGTEAITAGIGEFSSAGDFMSTASGAFSDLGGVMNMLPDINSGLGKALDFQNIIYSIFPGELEPKKALSDFYQLATGGSGTGDREKPSLLSIEEYIKTDESDKQTAEETNVNRKVRTDLGNYTAVDYAQPTKTEPDVVFNK